MTSNLFKYFEIRRIKCVQGIENWTKKRVQNQLLDLFCPRWILKAGYQYIFILFLFSRIFFTVKPEVLNTEFVVKFQCPCFFAK